MTSEYDYQVESLNSISEVPQPTTVYHAEFNRNVYMVAFSVEGQGFKTDSARLSMHSEFLRGMLSDIEENRHLGGPREGSVDHPIIIHGCTKEAFAHFMLWLNHVPWERPAITTVEGYLDILHLTHMWEISASFKFAVDAHHASIPSEILF